MAPDQDIVLTTKGKCKKEKERKKRREIGRENARKEESLL